MPMPATAMANQVRSAIWWPITTRDTPAVKNGPMARVTNTLATVVKLNASMKAVNITPQHTPDHHMADPDCQRR